MGIFGNPFTGEKIDLGASNLFQEGEEAKVQNLIDTSRFEPSAGPVIALAEDYLRQQKRSKRKEKEEKLRLAEQERLRPKVKGNEGILDYEKLAKLTKQFEATSGKAVSPEVIQGIMKGTVEAQIEPAIAREERSMDRAIQQQRLNIEQKRFEESVKAEQEQAQMGFVGDVLGVVGAVTVLCTELSRQGLLDISIVHQANIYRKKHVSHEVYQGYLIWATPLVEVMKKSPLVTKIVSSFWKPLTYELASRITGEGSNLMGKIVYSILAPFSKAVYHLKEVRTWQII